MLKQNFVEFQLLVLSQVIIKKSLAPASLSPSTRYLYTLVRSSHSHPFSKLNTPFSQLLLLSQDTLLPDHLHGHSNTHQYINISHVLGVQNCTQLSRCVTPVLSREEWSFLSLRVMLLLMQPRLSSPQWHFSGSCSMCCPQTPRTSSDSQPLVFKGACSYFSQMQDIALPFVEFHEIPVGPPLQPVKFPLNGSTQIWCSNHPF